MPGTLLLAFDAKQLERWKKSIHFPHTDKVISVDSLLPDGRFQHEGKQAQYEWSRFFPDYHSPELAGFLERAIRFHRGVTQTLAEQKPERALIFTDFSDPEVGALNAIALWVARQLKVPTWELSTLAIGHVCNPIQIKGEFENSWLKFRKQQPLYRGKFPYLFSNRFFNFQIERLLATHRPKSIPSFEYSLQS